MMQVLREKMTTVMLITLGAFLATIIFSWGAGGFKNRGMLEQGIVGQINGQKIQYQQFSMLVNQQLENYRQQDPDRDLPEYQVRAIRDQVWNNLVMEVLQAEAIQDLGLQATPEEVVFRLRNDPPAYLRQVEQFQTDGQFDMSKYQSALNDPRNYDNWIPIENYLRSAIPMEKLRQRIIAAIHVSDAEVREAYRLENEKVKARIVYFDPNGQSLENVLVTDADVKAYYQEHEEDYRQPEQRQIEYVSFEIKPSPEDSAQTLEDARYILERLEEGDAFEDLAKEFSKDSGSKDNGGDLGFFTKESMETPFAEAAFATRPGKLVGPVQTRHGLHIIKVLAKKKEDGEDKVHAQHILLNYEISSETRDAITDKAQYIYDEMQNQKDASLSDLVQQEGKTLVESPLFRQGGFIPGLGMAYRVVSLAFQNKIGYVSPPVYAGENLVLFRLTNVAKTRIQPIEDVRQGIERTLQREQRKVKASAAAQAFLAKVKGGMTLDAAAKDDSLEIIETDYFALQTSIPQVGLDAKVNGAAFALEVGGLSEVIDTDRGSYVLQVTDRMPMDEQLLAGEMETRRTQLLRQKQNNAWMGWINSLREKADIKDQREFYF